MNFKKIGLFSQEKNVQGMLGKFDLILLDEKELEKHQKGEVEILDIYNPRMERIGAASRKAYIQLGYFTRAVHGLLINSKGEILLEKRSMNKDTYPGFWAPSFAGHVDLGEDIPNAAMRELKEELGIESSPTYAGFFSCLKPENFVNQFFDFHFVLTDKEIKADAGEISQTKWVSLDELKKLDQEMMIPALRYEIDIMTEWIQNPIKFIEEEKKSVFRRPLVCFILVKDQQVLVEVKEADGSVKAGEVWILGGHVEAGETDKQAFQREINEELNITPTQYRNLYKVPWDRENGKKYWVNCYIVTEWTGEIQKNEAKELRWIKENEINQITDEMGRKVLQKVFATIKENNLVE